MSERFDLVVIGSGPGGQKAAVCAAKAGRRVALVEQDRELGGACVHRGTIPSKALRARVVAQTASGAGGPDPQQLAIGALLGRVGDTVKSYSETVRTQLLRNGIDCVHGRARFVSDREVEVRGPAGPSRRLDAEHFVVATGSRPRAPEDLPVDHEHVLDADSILSLAYFPRSLLVLGGGVIACEYASIFARAGVDVSVIDRGPRPLAFLDPTLSDGFLAAFEAMGGRYHAETAVQHLEFDGISKVVARLADDGRVAAEKAFVALGRQGCVEALDVGAAGLATNARGLLEVDAHCRTASPHIYAVGDVCGPPGLATSAMEQGRLAVRHALGLGASRLAGLVPTGIYTIPELASVGLTEPEAVSELGGASIGRAAFSETARGQISELGDGLLKLVADPEGERLLGVHVLGAQATELVHLGQMALLAGARVEDLLENVFNFPTLAECYRVAALDLANRCASAPNAKPDEPS